MGVSVYRVITIMGSAPPVPFPVPPVMGLASNAILIILGFMQLYRWLVCCLSLALDLPYSDAKNTKKIRHRAYCINKAKPTKLH